MPKPLRSRHRLQGEQKTNETAQERTMKKLNPLMWTGLVLALFLPWPSARAQQTSIDDLKKEIQTLTETVKSMQKDLQDIKSLLGNRAPAAPPQNVILDLGDSPAQGERTAKLTLVEFSDYQ
jgi:hypothetical protein